MPHALLIREKRPKGGKVYYPLQLQIISKPTPGPNELLVKMSAAALNHRDFFIRQNLYPNISFQSPLLSDGSGTVLEAGPGCSATSCALADRKSLVILTPSRGWESEVCGPEPVSWATFGAIGGVAVGSEESSSSNNNNNNNNNNRQQLAGTAQTYVVVHETEVEPSPEHLSPGEAAALPTCGLTAWRALVTKCGITPSKADTTTTAASAAAAEPGEGANVQCNNNLNILVTGIGGGVALHVLQFAVALGHNVWVTSGSEEKLQRARQLGARGGVLYTGGEWHRDLAALLPADRPYLDAVVDGAGGDIVVRTTGLLRHGGCISCYGMTVAPVMDWPMQAVLKNLELRGSTLGSRVEFRDMVAFVGEHRIRPVVSRAVRGLDCVDAIDGLFEDLRSGSQFGKLVIEF
ncbi:oxidoreductase [Diaporthe helianthi]|uniref:Oxidoreductase n=1 Tax=Diaporthe helianthi TaxID=158607 RepID=A0A2P5HYB3_DIAHE|nr:oxidoreductase [Diaporthe helianthi]